MAYTINKFDGSVLTVVEDGTIDNATDIKLVGKNFAGYGEVQNENFVFLLENFSSQTPPPRPVSGQIWFDANTSKLKFYDGNKFRTTGGAEISDETPTGLTEGDFWWDTENEQLYAFNGTEFVLVGPQDAGEGITQMQSRSLLGTDGITRSVIVSIINDNIVHIISNESFEISLDNRPPGFDVVKQGITLVNTRGSTGGVTSTNHIFWGTASNADKLGGVAADDYIRQGDADFQTLVEFADVGFAVGDSNDLRVFVDDDRGIISNEVGNSISFRAKDTQGINKNSLRILSNSILPGVQSDGESIENVTIGSETEPFDEVYATEFKGLAEKASSLLVNTEERFGDINATANTIAVRDQTGDLRANLFRGTALSAKYADLAEVYSVENNLSVGTVVTVCPHSSYEVCKSNSNDIILGTISDKPAYIMNSEAEGQAVALVGRVPVRVVGSVNKGEVVYSAENGTAATTGLGAIVGIALESNQDNSEKLVECVLKV